jgi:hypothetical protein
MMSSNGTVKVEIVHHVPGRMRLRFERGVDVVESAHKLETALAGVPGLKGLDLRPAARSVVIQYAPTEIEPGYTFEDRLLEAGIEFLTQEIRAAARVAGKTAVGDSIVRFAKSRNVELEKASNGLVDLRDAVPLSLVGLGLLKVFQGSLTRVPYYNLIYYGYSIFVNLHNHYNGTPRTQEPDALEILRRRRARGELSREEYRELLAELASAVA